MSDEIQINLIKEHAKAFGGKTTGDAFDKLFEHIESQQKEIETQRRYIGFLQSCVRGGERFDGDVNDFLRISVSLKGENKQSQSSHGYRPTD
jgi:hypothetical protein